MSGVKRSQNITVLHMKSYGADKNHI